MSESTNNSKESAQQVFVVFTPSGLRGQVARGTSVLEAARKIGADLDSVCGGRGICGRCQVQPSFGHFPKHAIECDQKSISAFSETEARYEKKRGLQKGRRLGCSTKINANMVIDIPPESQLKRQVIRKRSDARPISVDPILRLHYVEVEKPQLDSPSGDCERLLEALRKSWNLEITQIDLTVYPALQEALRKGDYKVTAVVRTEDSEGKTLIAVFPGLETNLYGFAIDIGSTTMSAQLIDLQSANIIAAQGMMNPQIRFGEDLMSRVSYAMLNDGGASAMTESIREALDKLFLEVAESCSIPREKILEVVLVGNPIMHHIFWGIDPIPLGGAPFALASASAISTPARDCGFKNLAPNARLYTPPCIAGHVGADAAAVALSEFIWDAVEPTLAIDIGTNAEILLAVGNKVFAASSPTGPAFEGAQIEHGQRAAAGAIERIRIDEKTFEPKFKVIEREGWSDEWNKDSHKDNDGNAGGDGSGNGKDSVKKNKAQNKREQNHPISGICGSGIIEGIGELYRVGLIGSDGLFSEEKAALTKRLRKEKRSFSYLLHEQADGRTITITQNDIRAVQLAKGALHAGARLLMKHAGLESVSRVLLAGAFGSHIDPLYALILGLVPDCEPEKVVPLGNAASSGARIALVNRKHRRLLEEKVREIVKIETATEPDFQQYFVEAMAFPHASDPYAKLRAVTQLPEFVAATKNTRRSGGRARARARERDASERDASERDAKIDASERDAKIDASERDAKIVAE